MKVSKRPLMELEPYDEETAWNEQMNKLGAIIKKRFKTGYVKCYAENMGWRHLTGFKVFECDTDSDEDLVSAKFLREFVPDSDWSARVYSYNNSRGLYFNVRHHDNPVLGDSYYLSPIRERTYLKYI